MKRTLPAPSGKNVKWVCPDPDFGKRFPTVSSYLCDPWWDDGKPREVGSLTIRMGDASVGIALTDPEAKASCYTTGATLYGALELMEEALAGGRAVWRRWKK